MNQYESSCIADDFIKNDYRLVPFNSQADIYIINTCTVTNRTDFKSRNAIRKALKRKAYNPSVKIVVTGCYSELNKKQIESLGDIDLILGNEAKGSIYELIRQVSLSPHSINKPVTASGAFKETTTDVIPGRVRAFVKIQDGCDLFCSYCIVPYARGKPRSRKPHHIIEQIKKLVASGYKEFVIAGINLGLYGKDFVYDSPEEENYDLSKMLSEIEKVKGVIRIRLSSIEPQLIDDKLLDYFKKSDKLCPHFHIPLQVGSDALLESVKRLYRCEEYAQLLRTIKHIIPDAAIGTDIILGLPGETDKHFRETYEFIEKLPITYAHVFPYSKREGTAAASMPEQVKQVTAKERCRIISELVETKKKDYIDKLIETNTVLGGVLESKTNNYWTALSDHYIRIYLRDNNNKEGDYIRLPAFAEKADGIEVISKP